jgi:carbonic anhydrase
MSVIDDVIAANEFYSLAHVPGQLTPKPRKHLAILSCMDTRLTMRSLGLNDGDAHIIRNAGAVVTEDALRSLLISEHLLETREFMIIAHTDCGMMKATEEELTAMMEEKSGTPVIAPAKFYAFKDAEEHVRIQLKKLRTHPWVPKDIVVRGFVYDVRTGKLKEVVSGR